VKLIISLLGASCIRKQAKGHGKRQPDPRRHIDNGEKRGKRINGRRGIKLGKETEKGQVTQRREG